MSGFDDNPFGEPIVDNPFADASIQAATRSTTSPQQTLDDYDPFSNDPVSQQRTQNNFGQPATLQPSSQTIPAYSQSGAQYNNNAAGSASSPAAMTQISTAELQRRQDELEKKAQELERREAELINSANASRPNNWPPLPSFCPMQPCFYHDINIDIPTEFQKIVQNLYYLWMFYTLVMAVNIIGGLVILIHSSDFRTFGLGIFYAVLFAPASFLCWYRPAYKAFKNDSSFNFMMFFFIFFFQTLVTIIQTIGFPGSGTCGVIMAIAQFSGGGLGILVGIFVLAIAVGYGACAAGNILMLSKIHAIYRSGTENNRITMDKARQEFQSGFFGNQIVRDAAAGAARATVQSQFNQNSAY
ncbi:secretory carrier-associated membrane protein 2 [Toxorhynchites rutilus septentrionalis]|uniref:secretory carrier-associated membrane protein 2 n=1 Tax=Toxorhynchites rutilus septentrionalis TaxID=329112 RepID=UPI002479E905|nr:secretory carrier-associated membrane protein 2 [Toxorhynchites rutilus septentrionalis]